MMFDVFWFTRPSYCCTTNAIATTIRETREDACIDLLIIYWIQCCTPLNVLHWSCNTATRLLKLQDKVSSESLLSSKAACNAWHKWRSAWVAEHDHLKCSWHSLYSMNKGCSTTHLRYHLPHVYNRRSIKWPKVEQRRQRDCRRRPLRRLFPWQR